jgi:hypothetical protein
MILSNISLETIYKLIDWYENYDENPVILSWLKEELIRRDTK